MGQPGVKPRATLYMHTFTMPSNVLVIVLLVVSLVSTGVVFGVLFITGHKHDPFVHPGPSPEARAVTRALRSLGEGGMAFDCAAYKMALGDMLEKNQMHRLCRDGEAVLQGAISECICGSAPAETTVPEDEDVLIALEDLGYDLIKREEPGIGNVTIRAPGPFNVTQCRMRLCDGDSCLDLVALQERLCGKDGEPRYPSNTAECVCLNDPMPPPVMCSPGDTLPVVWNDTLVGILTITQTNASITINVTTEDLCFQEPRVYIGAVESVMSPPFPHLPGAFPTSTWEQEITVEADGVGPARFGLPGIGFPPEWNHPGAPTFECCHILYLRWAALAKPAHSNGHCPSNMDAHGWLPAASDPMAFEYRFCCV